MLVLCALAKNGTLRISALKVRIEDISLRMLAPTLRQLEQDGFLSRTVRPTNPPRVEYALTRFGESLLARVSELVRWAKRKSPARAGGAQALRAPGLTACAS